MNRFVVGACLALLLALPAVAAQAAFRVKPAVVKTGGGVKISFALAAPTDVEVAVLDATNGVVRHLAAGVLGGTNAPPEPLKPGLVQELVWDGKDDSGRPAVGGASKIRVRAGIGVKFGRLIGANPFAMGRITGVASDADGNAYVMTTSSGTGNFKQILMLDAEANYVRTVMPFPANLPADRVSDWAMYDGRPLPNNHNALGPEPYTLSGLTLLGNADAKGLLLTDGQQILRVARDGGMVDGKFSHGRLWGKKALPNTGGGPTHLTPSPDGKYLYLSGPFSSKTAYGHEPDPDFPPGRVYRMEIGKGTMEPFVTLPVVGKHAASSGTTWTGPHISHPGNYTVAHGPIHDVAVDKDGNVLVADQDNGRVAIFDSTGREIGKIDVVCPDQIAVHPRSGEIYVLTRQIRGYQQFEKRLLKFSGMQDAHLVAEQKFAVDKFATPRMSLAAGEKKTVVWISGMPGGVMQVEDKGREFALAGDLQSRCADALGNADRIAVDPEANLVYINDAWGNFRRFNGLTGAGGEVIKLESGKSATDLAIGPGGMIYAQIDQGYSGPLFRYTRDLQPAPYAETGTHKLSGYIYGRYHGNGGCCEKGMGVSRNGTLYMSWMFGGWVRYAISAWTPDGKPLNGKYAPIDANHAAAGTPAELQKAVIGPIPGANAGVRVDSKGRIYVGMGMHAPGVPRPAGFEKDQGYDRIMGSIVRFGPDGGAWGKTKGEKVAAVLKKDAPKVDPPLLFFAPGPKPEGALQGNGDNYFVGADRIYEEFGPLSGGHEDTGGLGDPGFCHCRVGRFDLDGFDRLYIPNPVLNRIRIVDNANNLILTFGSYGNFDSQYVPPGSKTQQPLVATPEIPLGWPVGVGVSDSHLYISDMLNRRVVRADLTWQAEETVSVK
jgi:DNA-binding beta-propeller fold protein YncE